MGGISVNEAVCYGFVILSGVILLNAATDITMLEFPEAKRKLLVGEQLQLTWKFDVQNLAEQKWSVALFVYNFTTHSKDKLIRLNEKGELSKNPMVLPNVFQRLYCSLKYDTSSKGFAKFQLASTTFTDSAGYGLSFQTSGMKTGNPLENVTEIKIVDMLLNEKETSPPTIKTWIGQSVRLVCSVILKIGVDSPTFKWKNELKNVTITDNVVFERNRSILYLTPLNDDDFGSYRCRAKTDNTKIKYYINVMKMEKQGRPLSLRFARRIHSRSHSLSWEASRYDEHGSVSTFVVQMLQDKTTCAWVDVNTTSQLWLPLDSMATVLSGPNVPELCSVRVCRRDDKELENQLCSDVLRVESIISPRPYVDDLVVHRSGKATLSWARQEGDNTPILGYIVQVIKKSTKGKEDVLETIHVNSRTQNRGKHVFKNSDKIKDAFFRVCIRNSLCIHEASCSDKVSHYPVFPSKPRSIRVFYRENSTVIEVVWKRPVVQGPGSLHYTVEVQKAGSVHWKTIITTPNLHARFKASKMGDRVRVCVQNAVGREKTSCSKGIGLRKKASLGNVSGASRNYTVTGIFVVIASVLASLCSVIG